MAMPGAEWVALVPWPSLPSLPNVRLMPRTTVTGAYDRRHLRRAWSGWACTCPDAPCTCRANAFWRITAQAGRFWPRVRWSGRSPSPMNDRPGIMMAGAVQSLSPPVTASPRASASRFLPTMTARASVARESDGGRVCKVAAILDSRADACRRDRRLSGLDLNARVTNTEGRHGLTSLIEGSHANGDVQAGDGLSG